MTVDKYLASDIDMLAQRVLKLGEAYDGTNRIIITISGIPGSGKSTVAAKLMLQLNKLTSDVVMLSQDGFHYYRAELHSMPNPSEAIARRGAAFTFNVVRFVELVRKIKYDLNSTIYAPDFSHTLKDPEENKIPIHPHHKVVILEGNYVNIAHGDWKFIGEVATERWMVTADPSLVRDRVIARHLKAGISKTYKDACHRVDTNDLVNAYFILQNSPTPDVEIQN
ncbi:hypothetical protein CANTEDRAFT_111960 [Yamadazyma tenuis ATCC 10573]|uniref:Uncharacterized protein n=2 Tax=Candida tenuis TaxID=2315449 RepID=G3BD89_CANTC|nr:uncharacterized protein CANTEDRAFT_111960 [Yamadazyma tenuis ATCC 10573]EGV60270.1 hypothetical protein CANTEDRAFT_111960 [Yamadazyma tenuis ATCC 10573]